MRLKCSAPGSLMLLGEHAVLHGKQALVCAIDKRLTVTLTPREDNRLEITSALGHYSAELTRIRIEKPFEFILTAVQLFQDKIQSGFHLNIESEFSDQTGLGSSAAVTVATLATLAHWLEISLSPLDLVRLGRDVVRKVQGVGSGADIAASVYGGIVHYLADPVCVEKLAVMLPLQAVYAGYKTRTAEVIAQVQNRFLDQQSLFHSICDEIGQCTQAGVQAIRETNWKQLGKIMNDQQKKMDSLGVSSPLLQGIVDHLYQQPEIHGAKISGSGLGDCVVALGLLPESYQCRVENQILQRIPVSMTLQGVYCEKI